MQLWHVPASHVDQAWRDGAKSLGDACWRAGDEITTDQLKLMLGRGEYALLGVGDEKPEGWLAVAVQQLANKRVLMVHAISAPGKAEGGFELVRKFAQEQGCSAIRGACDEANQKVWERALQAKKLYSIMEIPI